MICLTCGRETDGVNHNRRGLRCTMCWALLPLTTPEPEVEQVKAVSPEPVKRGRKSAVNNSREEYEK